MGYHLVWIAPKGRDGGLDLLAQGDPLGVKGPRIKGQVKRREEKTTEDELRSFLSLIEQDDVGVYISLGGFTRGAEESARRASRRITLIDGDAFLDLWVEHYDRGRGGRSPAAADQAGRTSSTRGLTGGTVRPSGPIIAK